MLAWATSRTVGLPLPGAAGEVQSLGVQDVVAAVLGAGAVAAVLVAVIRGARAGGTIEAGFTTTAAVVLVLIGISVPTTTASSTNQCPFSRPVISPTGYRNKRP
ncbi:MAG: hypothetical protein WED83_01375 [Acidimicrobiia bacterium]